MHITSGYSLFTNCSFDATKNKLNCYRGKDCKERFCKNLREHSIRIVNYEKKELIPRELMQKISLIKSKKFATYVKKNFVKMMMTIKSIIKSEIIAITLENLEDLRIIYVI